MINWIMKKSGDIALKTDVGKLDLSHLPEEVTEIRDVSYLSDDNTGHKMDIYVRRDGSKKPILIDIHGGGFISEDKAMNRLFGNYMARLGFVVFELNVRLAYPEWTVFDQIEDVYKGVRFALEHAHEYEGDTDQIYIAGHSSGAVLAFVECMLSSSSEMLSDFGLQERDYNYKGLITDCGLMHFYKSSIAYWGMRKMVFPKGYEDDKRYRYLAVENNEYIHKLPRAALLTNSKDVLKKMTYHFDEVLTEKNIEHRLFEYGKDGHTGIIFKPYTDENQEVLMKVKDYLLQEK